HRLRPPRGPPEPGPLPRAGGPRLSGSPARRGRPRVLRLGAAGPREAATGGSLARRGRGIPATGGTHPTRAGHSGDGRVTDRVIGSSVGDGRVTHRVIGSSVGDGRVTHRVIGSSVGDGRVTDR